MHVFHVQGMTCGHCVRAVTEAITAHDPAAQVEVALAQGQVQVSSALSRDTLAALIAEEGYTVSAGA